jgi:hypothetical protein
MMAQKHLIQFVFIIFLVLTYSCSGESTAPKPTVFLDEERMIEITTDIQLVEAALNYRRNIGQDFTNTKAEYYAELFERHDIDLEIYQENVDYYNQKPARMEKIYDAVLKNLNDLQSDIPKENPD